MHVPVLLQETLDCLDLHPGDCAVDGTFGRGGHTFAILERIALEGRVLALDRDPCAIAWGKAEAARRGVHGRIVFVQDNFSNLISLIHAVRFPQPSAVLLDLGISSDQLADPSLGLSFQDDAPLDMRLDRSGEMRASDIIMHWSEQDLTELFQEYGEEPYAHSIARAVVEKRRSISRRGGSVTTGMFARWVEEAVPARRHRQHGRGMHPATLVFQALRIAVNQELDHLSRGLTAAREVLKPGGRIAVISFHSLEDRMVKTTFREWERAGLGQCAGRRAVRPGAKEIEQNPRARSAKLRCYKKKI